MRQLISKLKSATKSEALDLRILSTLIACFLFPCLLNAQENPWNTPSSPNPWATTPTKIDSTKIDSTKTPTPTNQMRSFYWQGDTVLCDGSDRTQIRRTLVDRGNNLEKCDAQFFGGLVLGSALSIFALPIFTVASVPNSKKAKNQIKTFKTENPQASSEEIEFIEAGLRNKRVKKAFLGAGTGMLLNAIVITCIALLSF